MLDQPLDQDGRVLDQFTVTHDVAGLHELTDRLQPHGSAHDPVLTPVE